MADDLYSQAEKAYDRLEMLATANSECRHHARNLQTPIKCALQIIDRDGWSRDVRATLERAVHRAWDYLYGV